MSNYISEQARIYKNVYIRNSSIDSFCSIGDCSSIYESHIEEKCEVGRRNLFVKTHIDKFTYTGDNTTIKNSSIGKFCSISWNVSIGGARHPMESASTCNQEWYEKLFGNGVIVDEYTRSINDSKTLIGNDVWIGNAAIINSGLKIGNGCVIGCGAVVTHDIPDYAIVVGQPARILRYRFSDNVIEKLLELRWWDWEFDVIKTYVPLLSMKLDKDILNQLLLISRRII